MDGFKKECKMIRAYANLDSGKKLVLVGLDGNNIRLLKEGKPIMFDLAFDGGGISDKVAIVYKNEEYESYKDELPKLGIIVFVFDDDVIDRLKNNQILKHDAGKYEFAVMVGKSLEAMWEMLKPMTNEKTMLKTDGFSPLDRMKFTPINN